jgi:hypothetical protein
MEPELKEQLRVKAVEVTYSDDLDYDFLTLDVSKAQPNAFKSEEDYFYRKIRGVRAARVVCPRHACSAALCAHLCESPCITKQCRMKFEV